MPRKVCSTYVEPRSGSVAVDQNRADVVELVLADLRMGRGRGVHLHLVLAIAELARDRRMRAALDTARRPLALACGAVAMRVCHHLGTVGIVEHDRRLAIDGDLRARRRHERQAELADLR